MQNTIFKMEKRSLKLLQVFLISLLAPLIAYLVNTTYDLQGGWGLLVAGIASLLLISYLTYHAISSLKEPSSWIYYAFAMGMFSSSVDLFIGLENDGLVSGFMTNYLKSGEPYLKTVHGTMICYFDGTFHYAMYVLMLYLLAKRRSHTELGLYWAGSIGHSMIVFMPGNVLGHHSIHPSILLNIPYCIFPVISGVHFFNYKRQKDEDFRSSKCNSSKVVRFLFIFLFSCLIILSVFRGFAVLDPKSHAIFGSYVSSVEPYVVHENAYPKMQMLTFMFLFVPLYLMSIFWSVDPKHAGSTKKWSLVMAGASLQAQLVHIGSSVRMNRDLVESPSIHAIFWLVNLSFLFVPHLFLAHLFSKESGGSSKSLKFATKKKS